MNVAKLFGFTDSRERRRVLFASAAILLAFGFIQPYDMHYSVLFANRHETIENIDYITERITLAYNLQRRIGLLMLGMIGLYFLSSRIGSPMRLNGALGWVGLSFIVFASMSFFWSDDIFLSIRRISVLLIILVASVGVARLFSLKQIMSICVINGVIVSALGLCAELFMGTFHPSHDLYRFAGVMNPITHATHCALLVISSYALSKVDETNANFYRCLITIGILFIVSTGSRVPLLSTVVAIMILKKVSDGRVYFWPIIAITLWIGILAYFIFDEKLFKYLGHILLLGRADESTMTLTGRIPLWREAIIYFRERPLVGYGYDSFWIPKRFTEFASASEFSVADFHNSYIDMLLSLGILGFMLGMALILITFYRAIRQFMITRAIPYAYALSLLVFLLINMSFLSILFRPEFTSFILAVVIMKFCFFPLRPRRFTGTSLLELNNPEGA